MIPDRRLTDSERRQVISWWKAKINSADIAFHLRLREHRVASVISNYVSNRHGKKASD